MWLSLVCISYLTLHPNSLSKQTSYPDPCVRDTLAQGSWGFPLQQFNSLPMDGLRHHCLPHPQKEEQSVVQKEDHVF